jgi:hypothetical protein
MLSKINAVFKHHAELIDRFIYNSCIYMYNIYRVFHDFRAYMQEVIS